MDVRQIEHILTPFLASLVERSHACGLLVPESEQGQGLPSLGFLEERYLELRGKTLGFENTSHFAKRKVLSHLHSHQS